MNRPEEQFVERVTRGLWILPRRKREIQRELLEHLEDLAAEYGLSDWTEELLEEHLGAIPDLCILFTQGGLPMWAKGLKWGIRGALGLVLMLILLDLYILWFYPMDPELIRMVKANQSYFNFLSPEGMIDTSQIIDWLDPNDAAGAQTLDQFTASLKAADEYQNQNSQAEEAYYQRPEIAERIQPATPTLQQISQQIQHATPLRQPIMPGGFGAGFGMTAAVNRETLLSNEERRALKEYCRQQSQEAFDHLCQLWTASPSSEYLGFRRPEVSEDDVNQFLQVKDLPIQQWSQNLKPEQVWLSVAVSIAMSHPREDVKEIVQLAKDITSRQFIYLKLQGLIHSLAERMESLPDDEAALLIQATARWCRLYMEAIHPNPEPLIDLLVLVAQARTIKSMLSGRLRTVDEMPAYRDALVAFSGIPYQDVLDHWPHFPESLAMQKGWRDIAASGFGQWALFRAQCRFMQRFCDAGSDAYFRYDILQRGIFLLFLQIALPNLENARVRTAVAAGYQNMAMAWLHFDKAYRENPDLTAFQPKALGVKDPFQEEGLSFQADGTGFELRSAGPNGVFDGKLYEPSNGMMSEGDLVWRIGRR